jgi:hypothetical protein
LGAVNGRYALRLTVVGHAQKKEKKKKNNDTAHSLKIQNWRLF